MFDALAAAKISTEDLGSFGMLLKLGDDSVAKALLFEAVIKMET